MKVLAPLIAAIVVCSCSSPPKPPTVDEKNKRPANVAAVVELQACRGDLDSTRQLARDRARSAAASKATVDQLTRAQALTQLAAETARQNSVYSFGFAYGSTKFKLDEAAEVRLLEQVREAPLVIVRGRTDGIADTAAESRIARQRAQAVEAWLLAAGIDPTRVRATWQSNGDHVADNSTLAGRSLNRRVEIEIYRTAPQLTFLSSAS